MGTAVLVGFDESPQARAALRHALSKFPGAAITVLHVNDPREWLFVDEESGDIVSDASYDRVQEAAEHVLAEARTIAAEFDADIETAVETGRPAGRIVAYAEEHDIDHTVVGSHGRRGLERFLLGSVAERVARRSPTSVTIIRESDVE